MASSSEYKHFVPPVPLNPHYRESLTLILIETLDQLKESFKKGYVMAWDTETTGLNPVESEIVGFSYSYDGITAYYCPVKHFDLALGKPALDLFYQALKDAKLQLLYNARFDIRMMEYSGYDMSIMYPKDPSTGQSYPKFIDVMNCSWLSDTNVLMPSLKASTLHFLGHQPPKFLETLGSEQNFQYVPARDAYEYACFTEDTLIITKHGLKQIAELKIGDLISTSTGYHKLLSILPQGNRKVIKVTTPDKTSFICTEDHKFAFQIGGDIFWVEARDLDKISFYNFYRGGASLNEIGNTFNYDMYNSSTDLVKNACIVVYLDEELPVFDLSIDGEHNFKLQCGLLAHNCEDAANTFNLFKVTYRYYKEAGVAAKLDNQCVYIIGQLEKQPLNMDIDYLVKLRDDVYKYVQETEQKIYDIAGHTFKIGSNRELTQVFLEQGIDTGERTKAGDMKTSIEVLNLYLRNHPECELLNLLIEYKEKFKLYNSYLKTLVDIAKQQDTVPPRFSYKLQSVPCLTNNNLVLLRDKGLVSIEEVKEQDYIWTQYGYKRVLWNNAHKTKEIIRVIFENGLFIEGTPHHPVLVNKGDENNIQLEWVTLEALNDGERVVFNHHTPSMYDEDVEPDLLSFTYFLGYLFSPYILSDLYNEDLFRRKITQFEKKLDTNKFIVNAKVDHINPPNMLEFITSNKPICWVRFIQGILSCVFSEKKAQTWNKKESSQFLLFSDDSIFLTVLMNMLFYLGIPSVIRYDGERCFLILDTLQSLVLFKSIIVEDSDSDYLKELFSSYNMTNYYIEYADSTVYSKEYLNDETTVYDIEVEDVHEYVANGSVTHNTGRMSCGKDAKNTYFAPINLQCLEENTLVKTEDGNKKIKDVTENDLVWDGFKFVPCKPLGSKREYCYKIKTLWGEIESSLEHQFLTLNYNTYELEFHTLEECINFHYPLVRDPQSLGSSFDDIYHHIEYRSLYHLRQSLVLDKYKYYLDLYKDYKFDIIQDCSHEFWNKKLDPTWLIKTVYDIYVPTYNQFTANGFIVHNSIPKPKSTKCYGRKATPEEIENKQDILGWMFSPDHPEWSPGKVVEGMSDHLNVRKAFLPQHPEDGDYVVSVDMCLEGGSPVQTKRGYIGISELKVGDFVLAPQGWVEVIRVMQTGVKKLIKVYPDNGGQAVYCTENHHFKLNGEKVEAKDIKEPLPSFSFYSYNKNIDDRNFLINILSPLLTIDSLKEKSFYILKNNLKNVIIEGLERYTRANISRWCGVKLSSFGHVLDYLSLPKTGKEYKYKVDYYVNNPFRECTPTSAYLLGFVFGDGNISEKKEKYFVLNISSTDFLHLKRIGEIFGSDVKIRHNTKNGNEWFTLDIPNTELCETLMSLGVKKRKSYVGCDLPIDWLGDNFRHFIRGLFDADGYVRTTSGLQLEIVGHDSYIKKIYDMMSNTWNYKFTESLSYITLRGNAEQKKFIYEYLYKDATIWLQRKRNIIDAWYIKNFGDIIMPVWNITVNTPEHEYYVNGILTSNCSEELRIVTNLYKERAWADVINTGGDLHHANSDAIFGKENYTKETRKKAKCISGKSLIFTTKGIKKLEDLCSKRILGDPQPINYTIATPEGMCKVTHFIYNGDRETRKLYFKDGSILEATPDHLVQSKGILKRIDELGIGDVVDYGTDVIEKEIVKIDESKSEVFDLTVDNKSHLFYANGFIVHNCAAFGMLYGQEYQGFQRKFPDMTLDEAKEFMAKFKRAIPNIIRGQQRTLSEAKRTGTFYTAFSRPRRVKHYLTSSDYREQAFGKRTCYSPDTEFLTIEGWKLAKDIKEDTLIAYYDPNTKNTSFTKAGERITNVSEESIQYKGNSSSWNVTPDHRMWIRSTTKDTFRFVEAKHLLSIKTCQAIGCSYLDKSLEEDSQKINTPLGEYSKEDLAELFGWVLTDGTISKKLDTLSISQSKPQNFSKLECLTKKFSGYISYKTLINRIPYRSNTVLLCRIHKREFIIWVVNQIKGRLKIERNIPEWIFKSSLSVRKKFIEAMLLGDGRIHENILSGSFDTPNKSIAEGFQIILNLSGYRAIYKYYKNKNQTDMYSVSYCQKEHVNFDFRPRKNGICNIQRVIHEPLEYSCFTVPSGILITRYNGYISYMGNCMNGVIQGTAADVLKLEFVRLWDYLFTKYPDVKFICTIHDEINYSVPRRLVKEVIPIIIKCMTVRLSTDLVALDCSLSAGNSLGNIIPFKYNFETKEFEPEWEEDTRKDKPEDDIENESEPIPKEEESIEEIDSKMFDL